jgi:hypothetical protein
MGFNVSKYSEQGYPVSLGGHEVLLSQEQIGLLIKKKLLELRSVRKNLEEFEIDPERLGELQIFIANLEDRYAETDSEKMVLNESLFRGGNFFEDYFFIVPHELIHWMSRIKEEDAYFHDPEEVLGFVCSIAYEMEAGSNIDEIWNKIYNKVSWHFSSESDAAEFFRRMCEKAQNMLMGD